MDKTQTKQSRYGAPGIDGAAPLATREERPRGFVARVGHGVASWFKTAVVTLAAMYVIGWLCITLVVAWMNRLNPTIARFDNTMNREFLARSMRPFALTADPAISLDEATRAYRNLQVDPRSGPGFAATYPTNSARNWDGMVLDPALFPTARPHSYEGPGMQVITAAQRGFSAREREVLKTIATSPVWRDFDIVARAAQLDNVGARFEVPFGPEASHYLMPLPRFTETKELAYAATARAAWHLAEGRRDSAETVLRSIVSFGLSLSDNAVFAIEALIGNVVVGIGRDALTQLYELTNDPRAREIGQALSRAGNSPVPRAMGIDPRAPYLERRSQLTAAAESPDVSRGIRFEMLALRTLHSCGDARELVLGPRPETRAVFERARRELARYPSERAVIDLLERANEVSVAAAYRPPDQAIFSTIDLVGRIYFNPRLGACALSGMNAFGR